MVRVKPFDWQQNRLLQYLMGQLAMFASIPFQLTHSVAHGPATSAAAAARPALSDDDPAVAAVPVNNDATGCERNNTELPDISHTHCNISYREPLKGRSQVW